MTAILKQMDDMHYTHYISTFKTRQDIIVSVSVPPLLATSCPEASHQLSALNHPGHLLLLKGVLITDISCG